MSEETHWKKLQNKDYLGSWDLDRNEQRVLSIVSVGKKLVFNPTSSSKEECTVATFTSGKPMILNTTNCKAIEKLYKTPYIEEWTGKQICVHAKEVKAFGEIVDALRVMDYIPNTKEVKCDECKSVVKKYKKMTPAQFVQKTQESHGKNLCFECATKATATKKAQEGK